MQPTQLAVLHADDCIKTAAKPTMILLRCTARRELAELAYLEI